MYILSYFEMLNISRHLQHHRNSSPYLCV